MTTLLRILPSLALYGLLLAVGGVGVSVLVENVRGFLEVV